MFEVILDEDWNIYYDKLDHAIQKRLMKKIEQLQFLPFARHLRHGLPFFVVEVNQYRITFEEKGNIRKIVFVGNHKQYEEWTLIKEE